MALLGCGKLEVLGVSARRKEKVHMFVLFVSFTLKRLEDATTVTHNAFRDCRVRLCASALLSMETVQTESGMGASVNSAVCSEPRLLAALPHAASLSCVFKDFRGRKEQVPCSVMNNISSSSGMIIQAFT